MTPQFQFFRGVQKGAMWVMPRGVAWCWVAVAVAAAVAAADMGAESRDWGVAEALTPAAKAAVGKTKNEEF